MCALKKSLFPAGWLIVLVAAGIAAASDTPVPTGGVSPLNAAGSKSDSPVITNLVFDAETKQYDAKPTDMGAPFIFNVTNTWTNEITIDRVQTSCGCTVASMPSNPWHLAPGGHGEVKAKMDLIGKPPGLITKTLTFYLSVKGVEAGKRMVTVKASVPAEHPASPAPMSAADRKAAMAKAKADPQQIFKDPKCAECHVNQGLHLQGKELYAADCGICHDSPNRETSVPDLQKLKLPPGAEYWKRLIADGKPNTMMPSFSVRQGGPLSDEQVSSLAGYLSMLAATRANPDGQ